MSKIKILYFVVYLLTILNIVLIGKLLFSKEERPLKKMPRQIIIEKLKFDKSQIDDYEVLIIEHRNVIDSLDDQIKKSKNKLYSYLIKPENSSEKDSLINIIATTQKSIEQTHFNHFLDIKKICKPNQLKDFESLTTDLTSIFAKHKRSHAK